MNLSQVLEELRKRPVTPRNAPSIVLGYHGTLASNVDAILKDGFKLKENPWDWLGPGLYFWQDAPNRAREWAIDWTKARRRVGPVAVIQAVLILSDCLDLADISWDPIIQTVTPSFLQHLEENGLDLKNHREGRLCGRHELDNAFFSYLVANLRREHGQQIRSIRAPITEGRPILEDSPVCFGHMSRSPSSIPGWSWIQWSYTMNERCSRRD